MKKRFIVYILVLIGLTSVLIISNWPKPDLRDIFSNPKFKAALKEAKKNALPQSAGMVTSFDVSPDGKEIVLAARFNDSITSDIWKMNIDGTNVKRLTYTANLPYSRRAVTLNNRRNEKHREPLRGAIEADSPKFSGKGNFIFYRMVYNFSLINPYTNEGLMMMDKDGKNQHEIKPMVMSPDETKYIRFVTKEKGDRKGNMVVFDAISNKPIKEIIECWSPFHIFWSPDSKKIVFAGSKEEKMGNSKVPIYLWVMDLEKGEVKELTWVATGCNTVLWSPDSTNLLIGTGARGELKDSGIWVFDLANDKEYRINDTVRAGRGAWSRSGKNVLFIARGKLDDDNKTNKNDFYLASSDASNLTHIAEQGGLEFSLVWDDKYILYSSYAQPEISLWLLSLDGMTNKKIVEKVYSEYAYQWVENKKGIVYICDNNLWFLDIESLKIKQLTDVMEYH